MLRRQIAKTFDRTQYRLHLRGRLGVGEPARFGSTLIKSSNFPP